MIVLPITIALICFDSFFVLMAVLIFLTVGKSLRYLIVANFGSDKAFEKLERQIQERNAIGEPRVVNRGMIIALNLLFIGFFIYTYFNSYSLILQALGGVTAISWIYDFLRTFASRQVKDSGEWSYKDTLSEIFLWFHNISTIAVVALIVVMRFV